MHVGAVQACRRFLNAVLWILRSGGAQRRLLPASLATGIRSLNDFHAGADMMSGRACMLAVASILMCSRY